MVKLVYSVDSGTGDVVVPDRTGAGVDDVAIDTGAENPVAEVAFWYEPLLGEPFDEVPLLELPLGEGTLPEADVKIPAEVVMGVELPYDTIDCELPMIIEGLELRSAEDDAIRVDKVDAEELGVCTEDAVRVVDTA